MEWLYTLTGRGVGFIVGLTGVGGGALMIPLLVLGLGFSPSVAVGTDFTLRLDYQSWRCGGAWHQRYH